MQVYSIELASPDPGYFPAGVHAPLSAPAESASATVTESNWYLRITWPYHIACPMCVDLFVLIYNAERKMSHLRNKLQHEYQLVLKVCSCVSAFCFIYNILSSQLQQDKKRSSLKRFTAILRSAICLREHLNENGFWTMENHPHIGRNILRPVAFPQPRSSWGKGGIWTPFLH